MALSATLACDHAGCRCSSPWSPWFKLTKMSVLRAVGGADGWYVDGGSVLCPDHAGERLNGAAQRETWTEYDRRMAEDERTERERLERIVAGNPGLRIDD